MKPKPLVSAVTVVMLAACALAQGQTQSGESQLNVGIGIGVPVSGLDLTRFGGGSDAPGASGLTLSPQYLHQLNSNLALGVEGTYMDFPSASITLPGPQAAADGDLLVIEGVGRYLTQPDGAWSPYLIGGVGLGRMAVTVSQGSSTILDTSSTGVQVSPGVGIKADLGPKLEAAGEFRWRLGTEDRSQFGTGLYNVLAFLVRLGWRY